ncbi:MAG: hypothetical protein CMF38_01155 [Legionellaceae bacterium]|nr:hypothetical protein [Legionellaceae bacterium]HAF87885.1 hypothetical protein [Legionellales bacterium]HCA89365.1 hypothetical protein [Legionellales bacterium]|tara:strand:+ start:3160 stop:3357 length:198 start_codon:yes stop_codon:yes gene_type:complete
MCRYQGFTLIEVLISLGLVIVFTLNLQQQQYALLQMSQKLKNTDFASQFITTCERSFIALCRHYF